MNGDVVDSDGVHAAPPADAAGERKRLQATQKVLESFFSETDGWQYIATLDNDSTTEEIRFVAAAFAATSDPRVRAAYLGEGAAHCPRRSPRTGRRARRRW